jgi:hypothetical protein
MSAIGDETEFKDCQTTVQNTLANSKRRDMTELDSRLNALGSRKSVRFGNN